MSKNTALTNLNCGGQTVSGFSVILTDDTSYPYNIDLSNYISPDKIANISSVTAKDSGGADITTTYSNYIARFASRPSTVTYNYATGYSDKAMNVTISGMSLAVVINATTLPNETFRTYVSDFDTDDNGTLSAGEIAAVTNINVYSKGISSLKGVEYFTALTSLNCKDNSITALDIRNCPGLTPGNITADSTVLITHGTLDGFPAFGKHSLILSGKLGLDFYATVPAGTNTDGAYADFTVNSKTGNPSMFSDADKTGDDYRFTCDINSVQMADTITAKFCYNGDKGTAIQDYTVKEYLDLIVTSTDLQTKSPDLVALAEAIKDYGHYVQIPLAAYNGWDLGTDHAIMDCVNENIDSDSADVAEKLRNYALISTDVKSSGIEKLEYDLDLESETALEIYLTPGEGAGTVSAYITDDDGEFDGTQNMAVYDPSAGEYVITISGISAHKLGKVYTVSITTSKGNGTVKASALSYADTVMQGSYDDDLKRAVIALYKYYAATMKYRGISVD